MQPRFSVLLLVSAIAAATPADAQRPKLGLGIGGGAILGSQLLEHEFVGRIDGLDIPVRREVNLEDVAVFSANAEWYIVPNVALRLHGAWGTGRLQVVTDAIVNDQDIQFEFESDFGDVRVSAYDVGLSIWPWAPGTAGFAPFITFGIGRFAYDFDAETGDGLFRAVGRRSERAWLLGLGADLHVWRTVTLRVEAMDHIVDSPLDPADFDSSVIPVRTSAFTEEVNNVRLTIGAHIYFPLDSYSTTDAP
jgi:hypothetical protein